MELSITIHKSLHDKRFVKYETVLEKKKNGQNELFHGVMHTVLVLEGTQPYVFPIIAVKRGCPLGFLGEKWVEDSEN